jgi:hypothetical protein
MGHRAIPTRVLLIGGPLVLSCLNAWLDTLRFTRMILSRHVERFYAGANAWKCLPKPRPNSRPSALTICRAFWLDPNLALAPRKNGAEFENGFKRVVQHPWYRNFEWGGLHDREGPLLPSGSREFPELLEYLKYVGFLVSYLC